MVIPISMHKILASFPLKWKMKNVTHVDSPVRFKYSENLITNQGTKFTLFQNSLEHPFYFYFFLVLTEKEKSPYQHTPIPY